MEVIKQIIYLVLVMCIIYLVFYLLTYRVDNAGARLNAPTINTPKIDMPDLEGATANVRNGIQGATDNVRGGFKSVAGHIADGADNVSETFRSAESGTRGGFISGTSTDPNSRASRTREISGEVKSGGLSSNNTGNRSLTGAMYGTRSYNRGGMWGEYEGPFLNGKPEGFGIFRYKRKGDLFIGQYVNGKRHGKGYSIFRSGKIMEREYFNNTLEREEKAKLRFGTRTITRDNMKGKYEGPLKSNVPHGLGYMEYKEGGIYVGWWSGGQKDGEGNFIEVGGAVVNQTWDNGVQIR